MIKEYIGRTVDIRKENDDLLISYVKPHKTVTKNTITRWLRTVMFQSGIDINKYCVHSIRSAAASKAKLCFLPLETILKSVGWSMQQLLGSTMISQLKEHIIFRMQYCVDMLYLMTLSWQRCRQ